VVGALLGAGLRLRTLHEYCYLNGERPFADMVAAPQRRWLPPPNVPPIPFMYGLVAEKE
jgi:hypothetical protein